MYNRYIPQPDGSHRRRTVQDPERRDPPREASREPAHCPPAPEPDCRPEPPRAEQAERRMPPCAHMRNPRQNRGERPCQNRCEPQQNRSTGVMDFLRQLLPRDFDTGDLLVVILLLLMSGDCADDQNTALLTLALYLFM